MWGGSQLGMYEDYELKYINMMKIWINTEINYVADDNLTSTQTHQNNDGELHF